MPFKDPQKQAEYAREYQRERHRKNFRENEAYRNRYRANKVAWREKQKALRAAACTHDELDKLALLDLHVLRERRRQEPLGYLR
jgi:hypothetical protein